MERRTAYSKKRKTIKKPLIITLFIILALAVAVYFFVYTNQKSDSILGEIRPSDKTVHINDKIVPAYDFNNNVYITAENLTLFGINVDYDKKSESLKIFSEKNYFITDNDFENSLIRLNEGEKIKQTGTKALIGDREVQSYKVKKYTIIPLASLSEFGAVSYDGANSYYCTLGDFTDRTEEFRAEAEAQSPAAPSFDPSVVVDDVANTDTQTADNGTQTGGKIIVLDPGHGKSSSLMSESEKAAEGWVQNGSGNWGEWRHFKYGQKSGDCEGSGCSGRVTPSGGCWYPISGGDRDTEPEINLNNALAAKSYLEQMGYTVRMARSSNDENPSITRRLTYCYPGNDTSLSPDAAAYVCIHSNAGGGSGTSYIALSGEYDQPEIPANYVDAGNTLGKYINDRVSAASGLSGNAPITFEPELIAFCKCPVVCAYLEIGFFDNSSDLAILTGSSDAIGRAIAEGIDAYMKDTQG